MERWFKVASILAVVLFGIFILPHAFAGSITYDANNDVIIVSGYKDPSSKTAWTFEDIYQADVSNGWGKVHKYVNPDNGKVVYVIDSHLEITGGGEVSADDPPNFIANDGITVWVKKSFIETADAYVKFGDVDANGYGYNGITLVAGRWYDVSWGGSNPADWKCLMFLGKAEIYGSYLRCEDGAVSVADNADVIIKDSELWGYLRFESSNLKLIRVKMFAFRGRGSGDFAEFCMTPAQFEDVVVKNFDYIASFYNQPGGTITLVRLKPINVRNAWSLPDMANANIYVIDANPLPDPTQVVWVRGWNMENAKVYFQFTLHVKVIDQNGNPVPNAIVTVVDAKGNTYSGLTDANGEVTFTVTSYKAVVTLNTTSDADVILGPFDNNFYWHVWKYTPFTIVVTKAGYQTYRSISDINSPTDILVVLSPDMAISGGLVVRDIQDEIPSFVYAWVGPTHLKFPIIVKNPQSSSVVLTRDDLEKIGLFIRLPVDVKPYANLEHIKVSEAVDRINLGTFTQINSTYWEINFTAPQDFSCDFNKGIVHLFVAKLSISAYDPNVRIVLRAYTDSNNYYETNRTLKEWHAWKSGSFTLMWAVCIANKVGNPDITNITKITIYIDDPTKVTVDTTSTTYNEKYVEIPKDRIYVVDKGSHLTVFWVDNGDTFTIGPNQERRFILTIHPTPWLDRIQTYANILSFDPTILQYNETASRASFYYEVYDIYKRMLEYISVMSYKTGKDIKDYIEVNLTNKVNTILAKLDQVLTNQTNIWNKLIDIENDVNTVYNEVLAAKQLVNNTNTTLYNKLLELEATLNYVKQRVDWILGNITQIVELKLNSMETTINNIYTDTQYLRDKVDTYIIPRIDTILTLTQEINATVHEINTTLYQHDQKVLSQLNTIQTKLDTIQSYVDEVEDLLKCNLVPANSVCDKLNTISSRINQLNTTVYEIRTVLTNLDSYIRNDLTNKINTLITKADQILYNQTKIWDRLIELQNNITTVYNEVVAVENLVQNVNTTLYNEVHTNRIYLEAINNTVNAILSDIQNTVIPKLNLIQGNLSDVQTKLDTIRSLVDCDLNPDAPICVKLNNIYLDTQYIRSKVDTIYSAILNMNDTVNDKLDVIYTYIGYVEGNLTEVKNLISGTLIPDVDYIKTKVDAIKTLLDSVAADVGYIKTTVGNMTYPRIVLLKTLYKPGETATIYIELKDYNGLPLSGKIVNVTVYDPDRVVISQGSASEVEPGLYLYSVTLPNKEGTYLVKAVYNNYTSYASFRVQSIAANLSVSGWNILLILPKFVVPSTTVRIDIIAKAITGRLIDPSSLTVKVYNPYGVVIYQGVPTRLSTGHYYVKVPLSKDAVKGQYRVEVTGSWMNIPTKSVSTFIVTSPGPVEISVSVEKTRYTTDEKQVCAVIRLKNEGLIAQEVKVEYWIEGITGKVYSKDSMNVYVPENTEIAREVCLDVPDSTGQYYFKAKVIYGENEVDTSVSEFSVLPGKVRIFPIAILGAGEGGSVSFYPAVALGTIFLATFAVYYYRERLLYALRRVARSYSRRSSGIADTLGKYWRYIVSYLVRCGRYIRKYLSKLSYSLNKFVRKLHRNVRNLLRR